MITKFDINRFEIQSNIGEMPGMDDHFYICCVFEISKFGEHDIRSKDTSSNTTISLQRQLVYYDT